MSFGIGFLECLDSIQDQAVHCAVELTITKGFEELYQDNEYFLRNGSLALHCLEFVALFLLAKALIVLGTSNYIHNTNGQEIVDEEELVNHILLSMLLRVQQLLPLVLLNTFLAELMDVLH